MTAANGIMAIAKGQSNVVTDINILQETLENIISSTESKYQAIIDSLKARIYDIEHNPSTDNEEIKNLSGPVYYELEDYVAQRDISRNKLVICIYSICEATLSNICEVFEISVIKEPRNDKSPKLCPVLNDRECSVRSKKQSTVYLGDYLYTLNPNYKSDWIEAKIVSSAIRNLRNYLTHSSDRKTRADKIVKELSTNGITSMSQIDGRIIIQDIQGVRQILHICYEMLIKAEQIAKANFPRITKPSYPAETSTMKIE